jgi:hypothetical protein
MKISYLQIHLKISKSGGKKNDNNDNNVNINNKGRMGICLATRHQYTTLRNYLEYKQGLNHWNEQDSK